MSLWGADIEFDLPELSNTCARIRNGRSWIPAAFFAVSFMAPMVARAPGALADCTPAAADNVVATCTGATVGQGAGAPGTNIDVSGYGSGTQANVSVTVVQGASVTGIIPQSASLGGGGIYLGGSAPSTITNAGLIQSSVANSIVLDAGGTVTNQSTGRVISIFNGLTIRSATGSVTNFGAISSGVSYNAVSLENGGAVTNNAGGSINGGSNGVLIQGAAGTVTNAGSINAATGDGVNFRSGMVENQAGGRVTGRGYGVFIDGSGTVTNAAGATITNLGQNLATAAVRIGTFGTVSNAGTIQSEAAFTYGVLLPGGGNVTNLAAGTIVGGASGILASGGGTVTNSGSIIGRALSGIELNSMPVAEVVNRAGGLISGGTTGISFISGLRRSNTLTNAGTIETSLGIAGTAVLAQADLGNTRITNSGIITGNVDLGAGNPAAGYNQFSNLAGGVFNAGATVNLGAAGTFTNAGTVVIGSGAGAMATTSLTGNYVQTSAGTLKVRADWASGTADKLAVTGPANLAGTLVVTPLGFPTNGALTKTFTVMTAAGGITSSGLTAPGTAAVTYALQQPDANTLNVQANVNFQGAGGQVVPDAGLAGYQQSVGGTLNSIYASGTVLGFMPSLMALGTSSQLGSALAQLSPLGDGAANTSTMKTGATFGSQLLSCRVAGQGDAGAFIREGQCLWARGGVRRADGEANAAGTGYRETSNVFSTGVQVDIGGPWRLGAGLAYETPHLRSQNGSSSDGDRLHAGAVVKYNPGPWLLALGLTGGHGWSTNSRYVSFGGFAASATSKSETSFMAGRFTGGYLVSFGNWYLKPQVEVAHTTLWRDAYTETGTGGIALSVQGSEANVWSVTPTLEAGIEVAVPGVGIARPFVKGGFTWRDTAAFATTSSFVGAPAGIAPFAISTKVDRTVAEIGAGVDVIGADDLVVRLQYDGQLGETSSQHAGSAKVSVKF